MGLKYGSRLWVRTQHSEFRDWMSQRSQGMRKRPCHKPYIVYLFGRWDIFLVDLHPLRANIAIATVLYNNQRNLDALRQEITKFEPRIEVRQIFKTYRAKEFSEKRVRAFFGILAANMMGLMREKTVCIRTLNKNKALRNLAYKTFVEINAGEKYGCKFDYDAYDIRLDLQEYPGNEYWLVALVDSKTPFPDRRLPEMDKL